MSPEGRRYGLPELLLLVLAVLGDHLRHGLVERPKGQSDRDDDQELLHGGSVEEGEEGVQHPVDDREGHAHSSQPPEELPEPVVGDAIVVVAGVVNAGHDLHDRGHLDLEQGLQPPAASHRGSKLVAVERGLQPAVFFLFGVFGLHIHLTCVLNSSDELPDECASVCKSAPLRTR